MFDEGFVMRTHGFVRSLTQLDDEQTLAFGELEENNSRAWYTVPKENEQLIQPLYFAQKHRNYMEFVGRAHYLSAQYSPTNQDGIVLTLERVVSPSPELPPVEMRKRRFK